MHQHLVVFSVWAEYWLEEPEDYKWWTPNGVASPSWDSLIKSMIVEGFNFLNKLAVKDSPTVYYKLFYCKKNATRNISTVRKRKTEKRLLNIWRKFKKNLPCLDEKKKWTREYQTVPVQDAVILCHDFSFLLFSSNTWNSLTVPKVI